MVMSLKAGERAAGKHVSAVHGEYGSAAGASAVSLFGVLHSKQGIETAGDHSSLQIGERFMSEANIREVVKEKYGQAALRAESGGSSCCGETGTSGCADPITSNLYEALQTVGIPEEALRSEEHTSELQPPRQLV